jgi:peptide deformylase
VIRPILQWGNPVLTTPPLEVTDFDYARAVAKDLCDTLDEVKTRYDFSRGCGISASQIGVLLRLSVLEFGGERYILANTGIRPMSEERAKVPEGCLSKFRLRGDALRWADVIMTGYDLDGNTQMVSNEGSVDFASLMQHEDGHNRGELYLGVLASGLRYHPEKPDFAQFPGPTV